MRAKQESRRLPGPQGVARRVSGGYEYERPQSHGWHRDSRRSPTGFMQAQVAVGMLTPTATSPRVKITQLPDYSITQFPKISNQRTIDSMPR